MITIVKQVSAFILTLCIILSIPVHAARVPRNRCIAHRGAMDLAPEGTLAAMQEAKKAGYTRFECDMWFTASGEFIICHDRLTDRQSGKSIPAYHLSTEIRKRYPIIRGRNVSKYPTQYYPTLQEVLAFAKKNNMKPFFHMKTTRGWTYRTYALKKLNRIIKKYKWSKDPVFFSSDEGVIRRMKAYNWKKGFLTRAHNGRKLRKAFAFARKNSCRYVIHPYKGSRKPKKRDRRAARKEGRILMCYRIDTKEKARKALRHGEQYIITNKILFSR